MGSAITSTAQFGHLLPTPSVIEPPSWYTSSCRYSRCIGVPSSSSSPGRSVGRRTQASLQSVYVAACFGCAFAGKRWFPRCERKSGIQRRAVSQATLDVDIVASTDEEQPWLKRFLPRECGPHVDAREMEARFLQATEERGLELYPKQKEAIHDVFGDSHVVLSTPTGSGKSLVASAMLFRAVAESERAYYTCPIKALVSEKFFSLCREFGPELVGMATGDVSINPTAPIICCTAEVLANVALREGETAPLCYAVMDEFHYFSDKGRGYAWEVPLLRLPGVQFLLMSATMGHNPGLHATITAVTGREVSVVSSKDRPVPLDWSYPENKVVEAISDLVQAGRSPVYVVNFTQRDAAALAQSLVSCPELSPTAEQREALMDAVRDVRFESPYGPRIRELLVNGMGLHHAGLLPKYRLLVEQMAQAGLLTCICGTDTLGVGVNVPIRTVLFTQLCKYNGEETGILSARDFHQIAGRAGRRGFDDQGSVVAVPPAHVVDNLRLEAKIAGEKTKKGKAKLQKRRQKAPDRGFVHWDEDTFAKLQKADPEPLLSQFQLSQGAVLSVLQGAEEYGRDGMAELRDIVNSSLRPAAQRAEMTTQVDRYIEALTEAGLLRREAASGSDGLCDGSGRLLVDSSLQRNFLLMEDVSLFLVQILPLLQWEYTNSEQAYAKAVLAVVEAMCENPTAVIKAQANSLRIKRNAELKAKQVSYEARITELDGIEHCQPLPCGQILKSAYASFLKKHPWVSKDAMQPKAVVLEMFEGQLTFKEFVERLSKGDKYKTVQRQEGLLLRYLTQVHKTMRSNIPEEYKNDALLEIEAFLLTTINDTDSSLLQEWESLKALENVEIKQETLETLATQTAPTNGRTDPAAPPESELEWRSLKARLRVEIRRFARHLAAGRWHDASLCLLATEADTWDEEALKSTVLNDCRRPMQQGRPDVLMSVMETEDGYEVAAEVYVSNGDDEADEECWLEFEVFAPWPRNSFEPLLRLVSIA